MIKKTKTQPTEEMTSCWRDSRNQVKSSVKRRLLAKVGCRPMCSFRPTRTRAAWGEWCQQRCLIPLTAHRLPRGRIVNALSNLPEPGNTVARKCQSHCKRLRRTKQPHLHPHILIRQKTEPTAESGFLLGAHIFKAHMLGIKPLDHEGTAESCVRKCEHV